MKLKKTIKWAIAAAAAVTTVAASVCIANAFTVNRDTCSGQEIRVLGDNTNGPVNYRYAYFDLGEAEAIKQAVKFKLTLSSTEYLRRDGVTFDPKCTLIYGGYKEDGSSYLIGNEVVNNGTPFDGVVECTFVRNEVYLSNGKFWLNLMGGSYANVEIKSIEFYDKDDNCILYGCAQELVGSSVGHAMGQWTFYQLAAPEITVDAQQNSDGTYAIIASVKVLEQTQPMLVGYDDSINADPDICTYNSDDITCNFTKNGAALTAADTDTLSYDPDLGVVGNTYVYAARSSVELTDTRNGNTITLYSPKTEATVRMNQLLLNDGDIELAALPTITRDDLYDTYWLLDRLNTASSTTVTAGLTADFTDSSAIGLPDFRKAKIAELDASGNPTGKYVYTAVRFESVTDFDLNSHAAQNVTLKARLICNDVRLENFDVDRPFSVSVPVAGDYIESVAISNSPKTEYNYHEDLDLAGGELKITYASGDTDTIPMTDPRVSVTGFYGANGSYPAADSTVRLTVTYTAPNGEYDPARTEGALFTDTYDVTISEIETMQMPVISPNGGNFSESVTVTITAQNGAKIYYTTDGTTPTANSTEYTAPFTITEDTVVKAIAVKDYCDDSEVAVARFVKKTIPTPPISGGRDNSTRPQAEYTFITEGGQLLNHSVNSGEGQFTFDKDSANKFVTMFRFDTSANKQVYVGVSKIGADGKAAIKLSGSGSYYAYIAETTMLTGDINNDGVVNALDAAAILKRCAGIADGANPAMADFNGDGKINAFDAAEILKKAVELS